MRPRAAKAEALARWATRRRIATALAIALLGQTGGAAWAAGPGSPPDAAPPPGAPAAASDAASGEEASTRFKRGLSLFEDGDYTLALVEFERAYQLAPTYRALYNIGLVNVQLGRYADATRTFEQYLHDGGAAISAARRAEVTKTLGDLKVRTATVEISTNEPSAEVSLDGKPIDAARLRGPMLIDAGEHQLRATAPGYQPGFRTITLAGADHAIVKLSLASILQQPQRGAPEERGRTIFWPGLVVTGALAAGAVASGVVMLNARAQNSSLRDAPLANTAAQAEETSSRNQANSAGIAADVLTGLAVATGVVSVVLSLRVDHSPKSPTLAISPQRITFSGSF